MYAEPTYVRRLMINASQCLNTVTGGWEDETFSARSFRNRDRSTAWNRTWRAIDAVFALVGDENHCYKSWRAGRIRAAAYLRNSQTYVPSEIRLD